MNAARGLVGCVAILAVSGCTALPPLCLPPAQAMTTAELFFGRRIGDRVGVSDAAFAQFVASEITPRFPEGASGQWRDPARGAIVREPSKLVLLTFQDSAQKRSDLAAIADAYKQRFSQQSVLTAIRAACVAF